MGRVKKSTRKFEKKHLKRTLDDRKDKAKLKQQHQLREKKKKRRQQNRSEEDTSDDEAVTPSAPKESKGNGSEVFEGMSVEQFFQGGFEIPEAPTKAKAKKKGKSETAGKQKRDQEDAKDQSDDDSEGTTESDAEELDELARHKQDLEQLEINDPEFYKYLKENDAELLDFTAAEKDDLSEVDDLSETEEELSKKKAKKGKNVEEDIDDLEDEDREGSDDVDTAVVVKMADVKKWKKALTEENSLRSLRQVVLAFRAAAHTNDTEESAGYKYAITSPDVYHGLLVLALKHIPDVLNHHLPIKESASGKLRLPTDSKKSRTLTPLLKSHAASLLHLLPMLTDAATQKLLLNSATSLLPYFLSFRKFLKSFLKAVVDIWSTNSNDEATRITAFLLLLRVATIGDDGLKENCLKALYAGLVKSSRQTTVHTIQGINLMKNSAAEVFGLPGMEKVGYQAGFGYIRQLAIHLRNSLTNNSKESYKTVYNWQYAHSLDFWSRVLAMHCDVLKEAQTGRESSLRPLIYPLVQVTLGAIRLIPTAQYYPLRFFLTRALLRLSMASGVYIPLAPLIFEVLSSAEVKKKPKPTTLKPLEFSVSIRAPKSYLRTRTYQDGIAEQVVELFGEFYVLYSKNVAFPELAIPTIVMLKRFIKKSQNSKFNGALHLLAQKLEQNSKWVQERRNKIEFAPNKREEVEGFMKDFEWENTPFGTYVTAQRKVREEKRRLLEESIREEREKSRHEAEESVDSDDDEMMVDSEDDEDGEEMEFDG